MKDSVLTYMEIIMVMTVFRFSVAAIFSLVAFEVCASDSGDKSKRPMPTISATPGPTISAYTPADEARIREARTARATLGAYVDSCQTGGAAWDASHAAKKAELQAKK